MLPSGWQIKKMRALIKSVNAGVSVNCDARAAGADEFGVLKISAVTTGIFRPGENKVIRVDELQRAAVNPIADRILISRSNTEALVGASIYVTRDYPNLFLPDTLWQLHPDPESGVHMPWLSQWLTSDATRSSLSRLATGTSGSMKKIGKEQLLSLSVQTPTPAEQFHIARILSTWDQAIIVTERLLANSVEQKQLLAHRVLMGKVRLRGFGANGERRQTPHGSLPQDWEYSGIGEVAVEVSQKLGNTDPYPVLSCTKHHGLVDSLTYFNKQVFSLDTSTYKVVPRGCFVYATNHIDEGSIGYQDLYDFGLVSPMYTVFSTNEKICNAYLFALLKTEHYRQIFASTTNASVDRRGSLRWKDFRNLHIPLPSIEEQEAIATVLSQAGREVDLMRTQLELLRAEKAALMDQLLTGKRRVRIPEVKQPEPQP